MSDKKKRGWRGVSGYGNEEDVRTVGEPERMLGDSSLEGVEMELGGAEVVGERSWCPPVLWRGAGRLHCACDYAWSSRAVGLRVV